MLVKFNCNCFKVVNYHLNSYWIRSFSVIIDFIAIQCKSWLTFLLKKSLRKLQFQVFVFLFIKNKWNAFQLVFIIFRQILEKKLSLNSVNWSFDWNNQIQIESEQMSKASTILIWKNNWDFCSWAIDVCLCANRICVSFPFSLSIIKSFFVVILMNRSR